MIEVANISVKFRNAQTYALSDISFIVGKGEHIGFLGPNGSGK
ncbi:MAG TPA: energy-coupling factor ABC transporter ATP-binding protein, partial [candidate division Zixibacteria bacterium]|nr:energy-coupling factor ABC transporter ATP-binding protein [candidate division Zixibacteria bacterium]